MKDKSGLTKKRLQAIEILEFIAEKMGKSKMFDGELWYDLEDGIVEILKEKKL